MRGRKSTPKVINGKVQKKNNHSPTPNYWNTAQKNVVIDVEKPGKGHKHFLKKRDIILFLELIPNWSAISQELDAILLCTADNDADGYYYHSGIICIAAWPKDQDIWLDKSYFEEHATLFERLGVKGIPQESGYYCEFSVEQIKAYQLLHIFLHELGHHWDRIQTKSRRTSARGEQYAEDYAFATEEQIWQDYQATFGVVLG